MKRTPIKNSSNVASIGYNKTKEILEVEFKGNKVYQYYGVTLEEYNDLMSSESKGKYLNSHIIPNKEVSKVEG